MKTNHKIYTRYIKRSIDIVFSLIIIIFLWWLYLLLGIFVRIKLGKPVVYKQKRPGMIDSQTGKEKIFTMYKFRTMTNEVDSNGELLPDSVRLTKFGRILRSTSLDELPEIINVLKGDMSLIGPRPLAVSYLKYYTQEEHHRHDVLPGLTGLAQVNGRNSISWDEKFRYDLEYVENCCFLLDLKIFLLTVKKILVREGIGQGENMPENLYDVRKGWLAENAIDSEESNHDDAAVSIKTSNLVSKK